MLNARGFMVGLAAVCLVICSVRGGARAGMAAGDTIADRELGQPDFFHSVPNTVDSASINDPDHMIIDRSVTPHRLFVTDEDNHRVLGYSNINALVTGSAPDLVVGQPDFFSSGCNTGGSGPSASNLCFPHGLALDSLHNLYVADSNNNRVLVFADPFATKAKTGQTAGFTAFMVFGQGGDFTSSACHFGNTTPNAESLCKPVGVAVDSSNNVWIGDYMNNRILVFFIPLVTDTVADVVIGQNGSFTSNTCNLGGVSGNPTAKSLCHPDIMAFDAAGNLFATDEANCRVLKYNNPLATTPPNTTANLVFGQGGSFTSNGCSPVTATSLNLPDGIDFDGSGNFFIADRQNNRVLEFKPPFAASPVPAVVFGQKGSFTANACGFGSPPMIAANSLCVPDGIAADTNGNLWINDQMNNRVLRFTPPFPTGSPGPSANLVMGQLNFTDSAANSVDSTSYDNPGGVAIDRTVSPNRLYVADTVNNRVLGYSNAVLFISGAAANLVIGQTDFAGAAANQGGIPGASTLNRPAGVAVNPVTGDLFVADQDNNRVLRFAAPFSSGKVANQSANRVFGQGGSFLNNGCPSPPSAASLCAPAGVALDAAGNLYVADQGNNRALLFKAPFPASPVASKIFGQSGPTGQFCNRNVTPSASTLCVPAQVAVDGSGHLYIADRSNSRVLEFNTPLTIQTANKVFGQHGSFSSGTCNNTALDANALCVPTGVIVDASGRLYVGDNGNNRILGFKTPLTSTTADMVFGQGDHFFTQNCNLGGSAPSPQTLCGPTMVAVDAAGDLFAADTLNNRALQYLQPYAKPGVLSLSATSLSFGSVPVGTKSAPMTVTLTNTGIVPIFIYTFTISGTNAADFAQTNNCIGSLQPAKACTENVTFKPSVKAKESAAITISDDASNAPQHISPITGTGS